MSVEPFSILHISAACVEGHGGPCHSTLLLVVCRSTRFLFMCRIKACWRVGLWPATVFRRCWQFAEGVANGGRRTLQIFPWCVEGVLLLLAVAKTRSRPSPLCQRSACCRHSLLAVAARRRFSDTHAIPGDPFQTLAAPPAPLGLVARPTLPPHLRLRACHSERSAASILCCVHPSVFPCVLLFLRVSIFNSVCSLNSDLYSYL